MSSDVTFGCLRVGKVGGALLAVTGFLAGCEEAGGTPGTDAGAEAGVGFVSANPRGDGDAGGVDTQDFSVGLDTSQAPDNLSVGLESFADAGATASSAPPTSAEPASSSGVDTSTPPVDTSVAPVDTSVAPAETSVAPVDTLVVPVETSAPPADTSAPSVETSAPVAETSVPPVETSVPPIDTSAPAETTEALDTSSVGETSEPGPSWQATIAAEASWVDLPATFRAVNLPDVNLTLTWGMVSAPTGSQITDAGLSGVNASQVSFVPDVAGFYTLRVVLTSGASTTTLEGVVQVADVDVAYLELTSGPDGGYVYEPKMVPSDQSTEPFVVGCSFDTWAWVQRDYAWWTDVLPSESTTLGFRYPHVPGEQTLFAYHYRYEEGRERRDATQVATVKSDCGRERPTDLQMGYFPDFSPPGKNLARIGYGDSSYLLSSPIDADQVVYPTASSPSSSDWLDETSIVWSGYTYDGNFGGPVVAVSSTVDERSRTILNCAIANSRFESIDEVAVVAGGLLVLSSDNLWYVPVRNDENGNPYAPCDAFYEGHVYIAGSVSDFEVASDGKTLALITTFYTEQSEEPRIALGVGPIDAPFDTDGQAWRVYGLESPYSYYTGLHWIAGSQQLVWTEVKYETEESDGYYWTYIYDSAIYKINADGSFRRTLVYNAQSDSLQNIVTTGVVDLPYYDSGSF